MSVSDSVRERFQRAHGVSLESAAQGLGDLSYLAGMKWLSKDAIRKFGRGYPRMRSDAGNSAEEKDRKNMEILSKW